MKIFLIISAISFLFYSCGENEEDVALAYRTDKGNKEVEAQASYNKLLMSLKNIPIPDSSEICNNIYHDIDGSLISCDENCEMVEGNCYNPYDMQVLLEITYVNFWKTKDINYKYVPYDNIGLLKLGEQKWKNGRLVDLDFSSLGYYNSSILFRLPESICNLTGIKHSYNSQINVEGHSLCETYFYDCIDKVGSQKMPLDEREDCPGYSIYDGNVYYDTDIEVLKDLRQSNQSLANIPLLKIGKQVWDNGRLVQLKLSDNEKINIIPETIINLSDFKRLDIKSDNMISLKQIPKPRFQNDTFQFVLNNKKTFYRDGNNIKRTEGEIKYKAFGEEYKSGEWIYYDEIGRMIQKNTYHNRYNQKKKFVYGILFSRYLYTYDENGKMTETLDY